MFENAKSQNSDKRTLFDEHNQNIPSVKDYNLENDTELIRYRQYNDKKYRRQAIPNQDNKGGIEDKEIILNKYDGNNLISQKDKWETFQLLSPTKLGLREDITTTETTTIENQSEESEENDNGDGDNDNRFIGTGRTEKEFDDDEEYYLDDETTTTIPTTTTLRVLDEEEYEKAFENSGEDINQYYLHFRQRHSFVEPYQLPSNKPLDDLEDIKFCQCPRVYWPTCATNGLTYMNYCIMNCLDKVLRRYGPCIEYRRGFGIMPNYIY